MINIISMAAQAGASFVSYEVLRLPYAVKDLFLEWLQIHEPLKKEKILSGIQTIRGGKLNDSDFRTRMGIAVIGVAVLIWLALGWRESGIVGIAIPATLSLTLLVFYLEGFTLNRITLFALIFSIGILVDDAIVVVENIVRHFHLPQNKGREWSSIAIEAVAEVGNPTILATFAVIAAVLPMAFVGGLMGPYMRPIPIGAGAAMEARGTLVTETCGECASGFHVRAPHLVHSGGLDRPVMQESPG